MHYTEQHVKKNQKFAAFENVKALEDYFPIYFQGKYKETYDKAKTFQVLEIILGLFGGISLFLGK